MPTHRLTDEQDVDERRLMPKLSEVYDPQPWWDGCACEGPGAGGRQEQHLGLQGLDSRTSPGYDGELIRR